MATKDGDCKIQPLIFPEVNTIESVINNKEQNREAGKILHLGGEELSCHYTHIKNHTTVFFNQVKNTPCT